MRQMLKHYCEHWHGELPASTLTLKRYILSMAGQVDVKLIQSRVYAIGKWHRDNLFTDPSADIFLREMLRGVVKVHRYDDLPSQETRALTVEDLSKICHDLESRCSDTLDARSYDFLSAHRDLAIYLLGYWGGFTGRELETLTLDSINFPDAGGLDIVLSITDVKDEQRKDYLIHHLQALRKLCPVEGLKNWLRVSQISHGPVFRSINRWGRISENRLSQSGINFTLQRADSSTGSHATLSSRSLPRGFADWANENGWTDLDIRDYLGVASERSIYSLHPLRSKAFAFRTVLLCDTRPQLDPS